MKRARRAGWSWAVAVGLLVSGEALGSTAEAWSPPGSVVEAPGGGVLGSSPATAIFNHRLYLAGSRSTGASSPRLFITSSANGSDFKRPTRVYGLGLGSSPALTVFHNQLFIAFRSDDASHRLVVLTSPNGASFVRPAREYDELRLGGSPAMAVFNNQLYIAFQSDGPDHRLVVTTTTDGVNFYSPTTRPYYGYRIGDPATTYDGIRLGSSPTMAVADHRLYITFPAADPRQGLLFTSSADGVHFDSPTAR